MLRKIKSMRKGQQVLQKSDISEEVIKKCYNQKPVYFKKVISELKETDGNLASQLEKATEGKGKDLIT